MFGFRRRRYLERTFSELVQEYGPPLHAFACRITGNEQAAEGILQEVFLRLWQTRGAWSLAGNMETWLYRLTEKRVIVYLKKKSSYKKQRRQLRKESIGNDVPGTATPASGDFQPSAPFAENDANLHQLLEKTYAGIRNHSATHVDAAGRLLEAIAPGILPHFLPRRRLHRNLGVAAVATAAAIMLALAGWLAWENQNAPEIPLMHQVNVLVK